MDRCCCNQPSGMRNHGHRHGGVDSMPVAMQYVPWQHWNQLSHKMVYLTLERGVQIMNQYDKKKLLNYIDAVSFALIDTTLYLDTHPNDQKAIDHFNQYQKARKQALKEYARNFEPLTIDSADIDDRFTWATDSWPWMKKGGC